MSSSCIRATSKDKLCRVNASLLTHTANYAYFRHTHSLSWCAWLGWCPKLPEVRLFARRSILDTMIGSEEQMTALSCPRDGYCSPKPLGAQLIVVP